MLVVRFAVNGRNNCVVVAGTPYIYVRTGRGEFVLPAKCQHRGGPLHLAEWEPGRDRLVCPWHGRATSVTQARRHGIAAVRRGEEVTAVFPGDGRHELCYLPVSEQLRR